MASSHYHSHSPQIQVKQMPLTETGVIRIRRDLHLICSMCAKLQKLRDPLHMLVRREHFSGILTSFRTYMSLQLVAESMVCVCFLFPVFKKVFGCTCCRANQGLNLCPLHWKHRFLTTGPPGKSQGSRLWWFKMKAGSCVQILAPWLNTLSSCACP